MSRNPVDVIHEELLALRRSIEHLALASLDKEEAKELNATLANALGKVGDLADAMPQRFADQLVDDRHLTSERAVAAAEDGARKGLEAVGSELRGMVGELTDRVDAATQGLSEATREAKRHRQGAWGWRGGLLATGALLGVLGVYGTETAKSFLSLEREVRIACGITVGQRVDQEDGSRFCATWIITPEQAARRRAREEG